MSGAERGWPTVRDYADLAAARGWAVSVSEAPRESQPLKVLRIEAPSGRQAIEVFLEWSDRLASTSVARLDRQLGCKSNLFR